MVEFCINKNIFFSNDNPLWQFLIGALGGFIAIFVVKLQNNFQKNSERKKTAIELSALFSEKASLLLSANSNFTRNYANNRYYISTIHFFTDEFEKQAIIGQSEMANSECNQINTEKHKIIAEIQGIIVKYNIHFGEDKNINSLLKTVFSYNFPKFPKLQPNRTSDEVNKNKIDYLENCNQVINNMKVNLFEISKIMKDNARKVNK